MKNLKCPECKNSKFEQEVREIYNRYINNQSEVIGFEDEITHDLEFGAIRCIECGRNCNDIFENKEITI